MSGWRIVPVMPTDAMLYLDGEPGSQIGDTAAQYRRQIWAAMLAAAPAAPIAEYTAEQARACQNWRGMDGATAWHLIERHAGCWGDVGRMMDAWLAANRETPNAGIQP